MKRKSYLNAPQGNENTRLALVIEDNKNWQTIICNVLQDLGLHPVCAQSFHQAMELATVRGFELISLDLDLQDKTMLGRMFLQVLPKKNRKTPIVIVTGVLELVQNENFELHGDSNLLGVFSKQSFVLNEFRHAVNKILQDTLDRDAQEPSLLAKWRSYKMNKLKPPVAKLLLSLILGIFFYCAINLPFLLLTNRGSEYAIGTPLILGNLLAATITLVYILLISGRIDSRQAVSIILALVSAISTTRIFSSNQDKRLMNMMSEKINTVINWFRRLSIRITKKTKDAAQ